METQKMPARLRWFDNAAKSKIILDVKWHHLQGNKEPYLSVDVKQCKKDGIVIHDYQEKVSFIKSVHPDFGMLLDNHLVNFSGEKSHNFANVKYFLNKVKEQVANPITYTKEDRVIRMQELMKELKKHTLIQGVSNFYFKEYIDIQSDMFKYKGHNNYESSRQHWIEQANKKERGLALKRYVEKINSFFDILSEYKKVYEQSTYNLPSKNDIWTIERFAEYINCNTDTAKDLFFSPDLDNDLAQLLKSNKISVKKDLDILTERYNIPTIQG